MKELIEKLTEYKDEQTLECSRIEFDELNLTTDSTQMALTYLDCFREFRIMFKNFDDQEVKGIIEKNLIIFSQLTDASIDYVDGNHLGDYMSTQKMKKVVKENYFSISDMLMMFKEVFK